jgi:hypothetical protein
MVMVYSEGDASASVSIRGDVEEEKEGWTNGRGRRFRSRPRARGIKNVRPFLSFVFFFFYKYWP